MGKKEKEKRKKNKENKQVNEEFSCELTKDINLRNEKQDKKDNNKKEC